MFSAPGRPVPREVDSAARTMRNVAARHAANGGDLLSPAAIRDWFEDMYWKAGPEHLGLKLAKAMIADFKTAISPFAPQPRNTG